MLELRCLLPQPGSGLDWLGRGVPEDSPQGSPTSALQHLLLLCVSAWHFFPFNPTQYSAGGLGGGTGRSRKGLPRGLAEQTSCCAVLWLLSGAQAASSSNGEVWIHHTCTSGQFRMPPSASGYPTFLLRMPHPPR